MFSLFLPSGDFSTINEDLINNIKIFSLKNVQYLKEMSAFDVSNLTVVSDQNC